jgi:hypothetical protein
VGSVVLQPDREWHPSLTYASPLRFAWPAARVLPSVTCEVKEYPRSPLLAVGGHNDPQDTQRRRRTQCAQPRECTAQTNALPQPGQSGMVSALSLSIHPISAESASIHLCKQAACHWKGTHAGGLSVPPAKSPIETLAPLGGGPPKWLAPAGSPQHESGGASPEVGEPSGGDKCQGAGPHVVIGLPPKEAGQVVAFQDEELHQGGAPHPQKSTRARLCWTVSRGCILPTNVT